MVYNFNHGLGWASSGVEYAQVYRAKMFRNVGIDAKFVFTDMFLSENIQRLSENIGLLDSEVIWLYSYFTDTHISPVTYTLSMFKESLGDQSFQEIREGKVVKLVFEGKGNFYSCYMQDEESDLLHRVEIVSKGYLTRKDFFTYCKVFSEYYGPMDGKAHLYGRRFYNEDGSTAYEEMIDDSSMMYRFPDRVLFSKEELIGYMVESLHLTSDDVVIIDRSTDIGQAIMMAAGPARVGIVVHADHFSEANTDENNILWNNYYEYPFSMHKRIDFYVCATDAQNKLMVEQFQKYHQVTPNVVTIPVGSTPLLRKPTSRRKHALITASRLASEKHVDWLIEAVVKVHEQIPDVSLDIYGKGALGNELKKRIEELGCESYVKLCGQHKLDEVYQNYEAYFAGSTSEGFGLTLLEAVSSGLPIIGFDVRYGNQTFIEHGKNGYLIPYDAEAEKTEKVQLLADAMTKLLSHEDLQSFHEHSYAIAEKYLTSEVEKKWKEFIVG